MMQYSIYNINVKKEDLFNDVSKMYPNYNFSYSNITKNDLFKLIVDFYKDYKNILSICTLKEIKLLKKLYENENYNIKLIDDRLTASHLIEKKLIVNDSDGNYYFYEEYIDSLKIAIKNINEEKMKKNDDLNEICDMFLTLFPLDNIYEFAKRIHVATNIEEKEILIFLSNNCNFLYKVFLEKVNNEIYIVSERVHYYYKEILKQRSNYEQFYFDLSSLKKVKERYEKVISYNSLILEDYKFSDVMICINYLVNINKSVDEIIECIKENISDFDIKKYNDKVINMINNMPSSALNGLTFSEYKNCLKKDEKYLQFKIKQANATLNKNDYILFNKLYSSLLEFTNEKYKISKVKNIYNYEFDGYYKNVSDINDCFIENKTIIIDEFVNTNPYKFTSKELDMIKKFNKSFTEEFAVVLTTKDYLGLLKNDKIYMVKTCVYNFDNVYDINILPVIAITTIIPFKNNLVCIGVYSGSKYADDTDLCEWLNKNISKIQKVYSL